MNEVATANANEVTGLSDVLQNAEKHHPSVDMIEFGKMFTESFQNKEDINGLTARVKAFLVGKNALPKAYEDEKRMKSFVQQKLNGLRAEYKEATGGKKELPSLARVPHAAGRPEVKTKRRQSLLSVLDQFGVEADEKTEENKEGQTAA